MKSLCLHNIDILEKFLKRLGFMQKYIVEKDDLKILRSPFVTFNVIFNFMKNLRLLNVSIHIIFFLSKSVHKRMC